MAERRRHEKSRETDVDPIKRDAGGSLTTAIEDLSSCVTSTDSATTKRRPPCERPDENGEPVNRKGEYERPNAFKGTGEPTDSPRHASTVHSGLRQMGATVLLPTFLGMFHTGRTFLSIADCR